MAVKKSTSTKRFLSWYWVKVFFFVIFCIHAGFFFAFLFQQMNSSGFPVQNLGWKLLAVFVVVFILLFIYITSFRRIPFVKRIAVFTRELFFIAYISSLLYLLALRFINPPITITQLANVARGYGLHKDNISAAAMGSNIKLAVISAEDQLFPDHDGFDVKAIKKAMVYNEKHPQKQRGASTISQQTAKNVFLWQGGGFLRKGFEVFFTYSIEKLWNKKIILARYLNVAEMGPGIFGVEAAAKKYFNKNAAALTRLEAAQIIACLPNPKKYTVQPLSRYVSVRAQRIAAQMNHLAGDEDIQAIIR